MKNIAEKWTNENNASSFWKSNWFFVSFLIVVNAIISAFLFKTIQFGDTIFYSHMTKVIVENNALYQHDFYSFYSILLSIINIPAYLIFKNEFFSIRLTTLIIFSALAPTFYLLFKKILHPHHKIATLLVLLNPWVILFCGVMSYAEGLSIFLLMFAFYFMLRHERLEKKDYLGFSLFVGISILARNHVLLYIWPFCVYMLYKLYLDNIKNKQSSKKKSEKKEIWQKIALMSLIVIPLLIYTVISHLLISGASAEKPIDYFTQLSVFLANTSHSLFVEGVLWINLLVLVFFVLPLVFGPLLLLFFYKRQKIGFNPLTAVIVSCIFLICFHAFFFQGSRLDPLVRLRYFVPIFVLSLPILFNKLHVDFTKKEAYKKKKIKGAQPAAGFATIIIILMLVFSTGLAVAVNFPQLMGELVKYYPSGYNTFTYHSINAFNTIEWVNDNIKPDSKMLIFLNEDQQIAHMDYYIPFLLREDMQTVAPKKDIDFMKYKISNKGTDLTSYYVLTNDDLNKYPEWFKGYNIKKVFSTKSPPIYSVYLLN